MNANPATQFATQETGGVLESLIDHLVGRRVRQRRIEDLGMRIIGRDLDTGQRNQGQLGRYAQILEMKTQQIRQFAADLLGYPVSTRIAVA